MDTVGGTEFWKHAGGARPAGVAGVPAQPWTPRVVPFNPDAATPALDFESTNVPVVMTPWEVREHISFLLREAVPDPRLASIQRALSTFTRDWQAAWACHRSQEHTSELQSLLRHSYAAFSLKIT